MIGIIIYIRMPVSESYVIKKASPRNRSTILGIYYFSSMEGGGILTPVCRIPDRPLRLRRKLHDFGDPSLGRYLYLFPPVARQPGLNVPAGI